MLPVSARWQPPDTGQSTAAPPLAITISAKRDTSLASVVDISIQILPGLISSSIAVTTALQASGLGKHVITVSHARINSAGLLPSFAPRLTKSDTKSAFRSCTYRSCPLRKRLPASFAPTFPSPTNPIFIICVPSCQFCQTLRNRGDMSFPKTTHHYAATDFRTISQ